ncbi:hypothetical protein BGZ65_011494 [Modicella reniformis]|uniref:Uncharacterized protein n=1 Tax=Modicella reniformis TaxID=1440133 RepID=A0A9P6MAF8_9FUNG|nr:hypothetical protein BGZ65_011494 [Modicella reniformis]
MSRTPSQAFRVQFSSKVITIPTRYDPKSKQLVVRWKDILQHFENAKAIMNEEDAVLFLTDDDLEDFMPLRIAYQPSVVLEVVIDNGQGDASATGTPSSALVAGSGSVPSGAVIDNDWSIRSQSLIASSGSEIRSLEGDVATLRITGANDNRSLIVRSHGVISGTPVEGTGERSGQLRLEMDSTMALQEQFHQLKQLVQQMHRQMEEQVQQSQEHNQQTELRLHQQADEILQRIHQMEQQGQIQPQLHQHIETSQKSLQMNQEMFRAFDRFTLQYRIQSILTMSFQEMPIPRLFIIIPKASSMVDEAGEPCSFQFRLYYLCECDSHTMGKTSGTPEVHMAKHSGYDLVNPNEFFDKYGTYLLVMMYMAKYGAKAGGLIVPPLLGLHLENDVEASQEHPDFVKKNISSLINDTITHLEETIGTIDRDSDASAYQKLNTLDLTQLKSYLRVRDGESVNGDLCQAMTQDGHCVWICSEHRQEYHETTMQRLKYVISANGGSYHEESGEVKIKIPTEELVKSVYTAMIKVCEIQALGNMLAPAVLDLKLGCRFSSLASNILISLANLNNLNNINSLALDFGRLSMVANISRAEIKDVVMKIVQLRDLTPEDLEFIRQCQPVLLEILHIPQETDEDQLCMILQHNPKLTELRIRCSGKRSFALIGLVISTREKAFQSGDPSALCTFKAIDEGLDPFEMDRFYSGDDNIAAQVLFSEGSVTFDMDVHIRLQYPVEDIDAALCEFIRQYGWSIRTLDMRSTFNDRHAIMLDEATKEQGSRIVNLNITPTSLKKSGQEAIDRVIKRSESLVSLRLTLVQLHECLQVPKALFLVERYKDRLNGLRLEGHSAETWLPQFAQKFPDREDFPMLDEFSVAFNARTSKLQECVQWIASIISPPPQPSTPLKIFRLSALDLQSAGWQAVIGAIDFSALQALYIKYSDLSLEELRFMVDRISENDVLPVPLDLLDLTSSSLISCPDTCALLARLHQKVPQVKITGIAVL